MIRRLSRRCRKHRRRRNPLLKPLMRSGLIVVSNIYLEEALELLLLHNQEMIQTFSSHTSQKAFANSIRLWRSVRRSKHFDATCERHSCKMLSAFAIIISNEILWCLSIWSCFPQLLRDPRISGSACHIHMDHLPRFQFNDEEGKERAEEEIGHLQEITSPHLCHMIAQECFPSLSTRSFSGSLFHIPLDSSFTHVYIQLKKLTPNALRSEDDGCLFPFP